MAVNVYENVTSQGSRIEQARVKMGSVLKNINFAGNIAQMLRTRTAEDNRLIVKLSIGLLIEILLCLFVIKPWWKGWRNSIFELIGDFNLIKLLRVLYKSNYIHEPSHAIHTNILKKCLFLLVTLLSKMNNLINRKMKNIHYSLSINKNSIKISSENLASGTVWIISINCTNWGKPI